MRRETANPLTTGLRNVHSTEFQDASRRADAGLRKGSRIEHSRVRVNQQSAMKPERNLTAPMVKLRLDSGYVLIPGC